MTPLWAAAALRDATGGAMPVPFDAAGVSIDSRTLRPGDLFVALVGDRDGHAHLADALARGAAGAMVHRTDGLPAGAPLLVVDDTLRGLTALGLAGRGRFGGRVVAVTGSVGKTTTKEMLRTALSAFGPAHAAQASYNNHWGVPLTLARLPRDAAFCVVEIGMNHPGEIAPLARLAAPHVAAVTAIAASHIGHLGSLEAIADEKASIREGLVPPGILVLPADSPFFARMARDGGSATVRSFGRSSFDRSSFGGSSFDQTGEARLMSWDGEVRARVGGQEVAFRLDAPGEHMAANAVAALAVCGALGLDPVRAAAALQGWSPMAGRGQQRRVGGIVLLDESYNASSASVRAALGVLRGMPGRRVAVLGDMLELGAFGPAEHEGLADAVAADADVLYACGPLMQHLFDAVPDAKRGAHAADSGTLAALVAGAVRPGDAVLVKGSLGSRMRLVVQCLEGLPQGLPPGERV
jgi:UDP-N-acetylmuramoyl-tripeptide--D-alanyl-D-alanine ligase